MKDFIRLDPVIVEQTQLLRDKLDKLAGVCHTILNEVVVDGIDCCLIREMTQAYGFIYVAGDTAKFNPKKTNEYLLQYCAVMQKTGRKDELGREIYSSSPSGRKFKITRRADHVLLSEGGIVLRVDGSTYDPFVKTRNKL